MIKIISNICSRGYMNIAPSYHLLQANSMILRYSFADKKQQPNQLTLKFSQIGSMTKQDEIITNGRSWQARELRIKSTQDLHKLWYVCVRQKNVLLADKIVQMKNNMKDTSVHRIKKLQKTMSRILSVINERAQIRKQYREKLEQQYIQTKRAELEKQVKSQPQPLPEITWELLRTKYHQLRNGIDNIDYLQRIWQKRQNFAARKQKGEQRLKKLSEDNQKFKSFWQKQMNFDERPTQQQILRSHVSNWKQLNLKQRKIVLGFLNAKRSKDAKNTFVKQLKILGQKLAHEQIKQRNTTQ